jgi:hypothetical protein
MRIRRSLFLAVAACSGTTPAAEPVGPPATVIAVPLTAATALAQGPRMQHQDLVPPFTLTASDGSGLQLVRVEAKAVLEGPLAFTELHLYFHNAENRRREGTFAITLPPHAAVSRFAMENDGQMMEAEVVEKQLARRAYDDFLHRKQDPALLEKAPGNQFTAKVFPIAPSADKHLVISYSQELPGSRYTLPLRGLPKVGKVDVQLAVMAPDGKRSTQQLNQRDWQPDQDFVSNVTTSAAAVASGTIVAAQVAVFDQGSGKLDTPTAMTMLVDTSASRGLGYVDYVRSIRTLVGQMAEKYKGLAIKVVAFDQDSEVIYDGPAAGYGEAADKKLIERGAAGASDLGQALAALKDPSARVVVITDGVMTAGDERAALIEDVKKLKKVDRLDVIVAGGIRDEELAGALVHAGLPHAGAVIDLDETDVADALGAPVLVDVPIDIAGAQWIYPHTIATARPGTSTMVYARLTKPAQTIDINIGGKTRSYGILGGTGPLVERAVASAEIDEREQQLATAKPDAMAAIKADIAKRSVAARVVSSQTSLLVLESDSDYARYGIDRKSLADVLAVRDGKIERLHRDQPVQIAQPEKPSVTNKPDVRMKRKAMEENPLADSRDESGGEGTAMALDEGKMGKKEYFKGGDSDGFDDVNGVPGGGAAPMDLKRQVDDPMPAAPVAAPAPPPRPPPATALPRAPRPEPAQNLRETETARDHERTVQVEHRAIAQRAERLVTVDAARNAGVLGSTATGNDQPLEQQSRDNWPPANAPAALTGELADIERLLAHKDIDKALSLARDWHAKEPGDVLALIGLGDALEAKGAAPTAARIYGSIIDLFPGRADLRRFAGERLARVTKQMPGVQTLIVDDLQRAVADRPDHLTGHRQLAYALFRAGKPAEAFAAILAAIDQPYRNDSYLGAQRVLAEDAGMLGAAYIAASPTKRGDVMAELKKRNLKLVTSSSTRFILYWETDGNDVDFHINDAHGNHAFFSHKQLESGGELYADITTGYGPECFAIEGTPKAGPYRLSINYYSQGPMGYGMGLLETQRFDGKGGLTFEDRPYVIMTNQAFVDLGMFK